MEWSDALPSHRGGALPSLRSKVAQVELPPEAAASLQAELFGGRGGEALSRCAQTVDTARLFLRSTGGASRLTAAAAELDLVEYVQNVLLLEPAHLGARASAFAGVQLRHLEALSQLLQQASARDGLSLVAPKYAEPLPEAEAHTIDTAAMLLHSSSQLRVVVQLTRDFCIAQLRETFLAADVSLGACLGCMELGEGMLQDALWFRESSLGRTLAEVKLAHALAALATLQAVQDRLDKTAGEDVHATP